CLDTIILTEGLGLWLPLFSVNYHFTQLYGLNCGMGKSTAINRILQTMPQIISHSDYKGRQLSMYQIAYLKLECPPDGSIRGLLNNFFAEIDKLVGTNHLNRFGKNGKLSSASLIPIVAQIARSCNLGIIVVDEIQNLSLARSGGAEQMLSFFVTLSNSIGLPTILIGTPKSMSLFSELRIARRGSGQGDMVWEPMRKHEQSWRLFIEGLWDYQWIRKPTPLTVELNDAIHEASCGITDIAIKTFVMSQIKAITSGTEQLTPQLIKGIAKDNLKLVQPMLDALRSGNAVQIAKYADIQPIQIEGFVAAEQSKLDLGNMLKSFQKTHQDQKKNTERLKQDAIVRLTLLGIDEKEAKRRVNEVFIQQPELQNVREIVQAAYKMYLGVSEPELVHAEKTQVKDELDLRAIVKAGKDKGKSAYQSLKDAGVIASDFVLC
uniref:ATP-binding protein n=1 Tax=Cohnella thermotolerans TaxID=329858 RepID=UPI0012EC0D7A